MLEPKEEDINFFQMSPALNSPPPETDTYTSNVEVDQFLLSALANPRDRLTILKLDHDLAKFMKETQLFRLEFPPMSSYQRLIVHRVAQYYKLDHTVVDIEGGKGIVLTKNQDSNIPQIRFNNLIERPENSSTPKTVKIMRRQTPEGKKTNTEETTSTPNKPMKVMTSVAFKDRTLEEREEEYAKARARIFGDLKPEDFISAELAETTLKTETLENDIQDEDFNRSAFKSFESDFQRKISPELNFDHWRLWNSENIDSYDYYDYNIMNDFRNYPNSYSPLTAWGDRWYQFCTNYQVAEPILPNSSEFSTGYSTQKSSPIQQGKTFEGQNETQTSDTVPNPNVGSTLPLYRGTQNFNPEESSTPWSFYAHNGLTYVAPPDSAGFPSYTDMIYERRPPKSTELFDPNAPSSNMKKNETDNLIEKMKKTTNLNENHSFFSSQDGFGVQGNHQSKRKTKNNSNSFLISN